MSDIPATADAVAGETPIRTATLYRLSGLAVMIGMMINGVASVVYPRQDNIAFYLNTFVFIDDIAKLVGSLIFLLGFPGLYAFQATRAGTLGLVGFALSFVGLAILEVSTDALFAFVGPVLAAHNQTHFLLDGGLERHLGGEFIAYFTFSYVVVVVGFLSFAVATFRAGVYPRWTGVVIGIGTVAAIALAPLVVVPSGPFRLDRIGVLAFACAFVGCGRHLWSAAVATGHSTGDVMKKDVRRELDS